MSAQDRRSSILDSAVPLLMEQGSGVTTRQIAHAAGVAEGTLFRVFEDKQAILDAAVERFMDPAPILDALAAIDIDQPLEARLLRVTELVRDRFRGVMGIMQALGLREPPRHDHGNQHSADHARGPATRLFDRDRDQLRVEPADVVHYIKLLCFASTVPGFAGERPTSNEEIVALLMAGVKEGK